MAPYLTASAAESRLLTRFGFEADLLAGDLDIASDELDALAPFAGAKKVATQDREFPRLGQTTTPEAILDWVALRAYQLSVDDEAPVQSESAGRVSVSYFRPKYSQAERYMRHLLKPYRSSAPARIV